MFYLEASGNLTDAAKTWKDKIWSWSTDMSMWEHVLMTALRILIIVVLTRVFIKVIFKIIDTSLRRRETSRINVNARRFITAGELLKNVVSVAGNFVMMMLLLAEIGINLTPLLTGAGVLGLAIGFGAQSLVKDVITGFFIILEDQFAVGDVIQTGNLKGTVEIIGLRTTRLISWKGEVHIIPNGLITTVTNFSLNNALAVVDIPVSNQYRVEDITSLLRTSMNDLNEATDYVTKAPHVLGLQSVTTSEYVIRISGECIPGKRAELERLIQAYAKEAMEKTDSALQEQVQAKA
ncbi:small conductance mechanosensitive channel [Paenibacillus shirakamiensis]|uniref:Small conductance mechanosensitive channel n=1 Tax=Paenibacillus shirakamiensis TaxID=1265935 RepID=A0ABS4JMJ6_9BACL|nr:mechanosensitive ion channel domain-containing protein [Paenibacillus shirakamiensis]MBP2002345.1 small conductance mechanosensitive channel [Paenibacillus shirakamiensis]